MGNCFQSKVLESAFPISCLFWHWFPLPVLLQHLSRSCGGLTMDKPNSAIWARRFARTPEAEWVAKQICLIFPSTSHLCLHQTLWGCSWTALPSRRQAGSWWLCCSGDGVGDSNTTGGCIEVVPVHSSWQIMQYLLANILLKWFSRCMYWICFIGPGWVLRQWRHRSPVTSACVSVTFNN